MKILLIPQGFNKPELFIDLLLAFQKKGEAKIHDNLEDSINFKPDLVFYQSGLTNDECIRLKLETGCKFTMWTGDCRYAPMQSLVDLKDIVDQYFLPFTSTLKGTFQNLLGKKCSYIFEPIQNWRFIPPIEKNDGYIAFVGNHYDHFAGGKERQRILGFIEKYGGETMFYGSPYSHVENTTVPTVYNNAFAVICENNMSDIDGYFTPRNLGAMAAGSCALMKVFPGIEKYFSNWVHCVYYRHEYELLDVIDFLRRNPEVRNKIAGQGYQYVSANFSNDEFVSEYLRQL